LLIKGEAIQRYHLREKGLIEGSPKRGEQKKRIEQSKNSQELSALSPYSRSNKRI